MSPSNTCVHCWIAQRETCQFNWSCNAYKANSCEKYEAKSTQHVEVHAVLMSLVSCAHSPCISYELIPTVPTYFFMKSAVILVFISEQLVVRTVCMNDNCALHISLNILNPMYHVSSCKSCACLVVLQSTCKPKVDQCAEYSPTVPANQTMDSLQCSASKSWCNGEF